MSEPGPQEIVVSWVFDAPRELVFRAFTDAGLVARWWVPAEEEELEVEELDPRPGGGWRFLNTDADGNTYSFRGVFHSVTPGRIVQTFEYGGMPGHVLLETLTFTDLGDGRTRLTDSSVFQSVAARDAMAGGDDGGARDSMCRLAVLLAELQSGSGPLGPGRGSRSGPG
ncbi:MAG: Ligand-binding SRPBCC domain protein family [uncultured Corynebacteriales bacterium]|uniref:Ligand-binding SRPBCC domain protein family n=1 Tax=uncultured Mycobacteriales bacterium TaxID=581187 RepID=A0A6J4K185_9ACTN|nr:MAG: Ligand-binding SRPBCC domain protein family [uncultured Corynebacteriales bacterium]